MTDATKRPFTPDEVAELREIAEMLIDHRQCPEFPCKHCTDEAALVKEKQ